ncbi:MAG: M48 family metalloprotease [Desulfuromonadaceae bacterium]|nr:M48 family metalloprotease [Desulfuromonadaceae bacterium]
MKDPCQTNSIKRMRNLFQTVLILAGMLAIFGLLGWILLGKEGILWSLMFGVVLTFATPRLPPKLFLQRQGAHRLHPEEADGLYGIARELSRLAELPKVPGLYYIGSEVMNAFSLGRREDAAIVVTDGLIRGLDWREMAAVLAHEIGHIRNNDLFIHSLADAMTRVTGLLATFGNILILLYLPMLLFSDLRISPIVLLVLVLAPSLSSLLQLALSRTREFEADLTASYLTGDPRGLAAALAKMEHQGRSIWETIFRPRRKTLTPSVLRTHPHTEERVRRLLQLAEEFENRPPDCPEMPGGQFRQDSVAEGEMYRHWLKSWF